MMNQQLPENEQDMETILHIHAPNLHELGEIEWGGDLQSFLQELSRHDGLGKVFAGARIEREVRPKQELK